MSGFSLVDLQVAMYRILNGDSFLTRTLGVGVYDYVPDDAEYPLTRIGDDEGSDNDTKDGQSLRITSEIHSWSRDRGAEEIKKIMSRIYDLLHDKDLGIVGQQVTLCMQTFVKVMRDPDGITRHGVQRFQITTYSNS